MLKSTLVLVLVAVPSSAFALDQSVHQAISHDACVGAGLPQDFCERVGTEAYNVDSYEWSHPEAHAQIDDGAIGNACGAANAVLERERQLGADIRNSLGQLAGSPSEDLRIHIATQLGRSLHTIQDDCAHHGMPNAQHAWWSRLDACSGSHTSPDAQPEAASCARTETDAVLAAFNNALSNAGLSATALDNVSEGWTHWPKRGDVCDFLHEAETWDGTDRRWNNAIVVPWLRDQLVHAIATDDSSLGDACAEDIAVASPDAHVDVSSPPPFCFKLKAYCLGAGGKADGEVEAPPPWETSDEPTSSGCSVGNDASAGWLLFGFAAAGIALRRRSRA
jgi:MYXO-CTERM domain-containing protein